MTIVNAILLFGIGWGFWLVWEVVKHTQAAKIEAWRYKQRVIREYEAMKVQQALKWAERNKIEECEVEEWDVVEQGKREPKQYPVLKLEISNLPVKNRG